MTTLTELENATDLLALTETMLANKCRFSCLICHVIEGEYDKSEEGFLYGALCKQCAGTMLEIVNKDTHDHPEIKAYLAHRTASRNAIIADLKRDLKKAMG